MADPFQDLIRQLLSNQEQGPPSGRMAGPPPIAPAPGTANGLPQQNLEQQMQQEEADIRANGSPLGPPAPMPMPSVDLLGDAIYIQPGTPYRGPNGESWIRGQEPDHVKALIEGSGPNMRVNPFSNMPAPATAPPMPVPAQRPAAKR